jgi:hypothetical protein
MECILPIERDYWFIVCSTSTGNAWHREHIGLFGNPDLVNHRFILLIGGHALIFANTSIIFSLPAFFSPTD